MGDYWNSENTMRIPAKKPVPDKPAPLSDAEKEILSWPLETYQDCVVALERITKQQLAMQIVPTLAESHSKRIQELMNGMKMRDTMNPEWQAKRAFTAEAAIQAARSLTPERAKEILLGHRIKLLVEQMSLPGEAIPLPAPDVVDVEVKPVTTAEKPAQVAEIAKQSDALRTKMRDMVAEKRKLRGKEG